MNGGKNGCTDEKPGRIWQMIIVESSQKVEVDFVVVENVSVDSHEPNQINEVKESSPDGKGSFEVIVGCKIDFEVNDDEKDCDNDEDDSGKPES